MIIYTVFDWTAQIMFQLKTKSGKNFLEAVLDLLKNQGNYSVDFNYSTEK